MILSPELIKLTITGLILGGSGTLIYQLRSAPVKLFNKLKQRFIYSVKVYQYDDLFTMLEDWFSSHHESQYRDVEATVSYHDSSYPRAYNDDGNDKKVITLKQEENTFIFKYKGKKLLVDKNKEKLDKAQSLKELYFRKYSISGFRAKAAINDLLSEVLLFNERKNMKNTIKVYSNTSYGEWYSGNTIKVKPIEKTILNKEKKDFIINDIEKFISSEEWYINTSIAYKRGYGFYGPPGTGKTTLALSLANSLKRNVYAINLNSLQDDSRLAPCINQIPPNSILLIEDIDKVFVGRDNVNSESKVTFSSLLNVLDGAFYKHGLITIITTNHIEKLDPALIRSGRIDVKVEVTNPSYLEINEYCEIFYGVPFDLRGNFNISMSDIQEICLRNVDNSEKAIEEIKKDLVV